MTRVLSYISDIYRGRGDSLLRGERERESAYKTGSRRNLGFLSRPGQTEQSMCVRMAINFCITYTRDKEFKCMRARAFVCVYICACTFTRNNQYASVIINSGLYAMTFQSDCIASVSLCSAARYIYTTNIACI